MNKSPQPERQASRVVIHSFVVHVWREKAGARRFVWRGSLTDAQGGSVKYFQSLPALAELMAEALRTGPHEKGVLPKKKP